MCGSDILSSAGVSLMLLQLLGGARVVVYFRNDDQIGSVLTRTTPSQRTIENTN